MSARVIVALVAFTGSATASTVCETTVSGVDVSKYDGTIDWPSVKAAGVSFAMARISDGMTVDATFATNWQGMHAAGLIRAAYQFFEPGDDPTTLAMIAAAATGTLGAGDLPLVLDVEVTGGQPMSTIVANIQTWLDVAEMATGKKPLIYAGANFWDSEVDVTFSGVGLWVANYCSDCCPKLPTDFSDWRFWQYSDTGSVAGISGMGMVDLDTFNGSLAELSQLAGLSPDAGVNLDAGVNPDAGDLGHVDAGGANDGASSEADTHASGCSYSDHY